MTKTLRLSISTHISVPNGPLPGDEDSIVSDEINILENHDQTEILFSGEEALKLRKHLFTFLFFSLSKLERLEVLMSCDGVTDKVAEEIYATFFAKGLEEILSSEEGIKKLSNNQTIKQIAIENRIYLKGNLNESRQCKVNCG